MLSTLSLSYCTKNTPQTPLDRNLNLSLGNIVHALFLEDMAQRNPELFDFLHTRQNQLRPYKLSWPGQSIADNGNLVLSWQITSLTCQMADYLSEWTQNPTEHLTAKQLEQQLACQAHHLTDAISYANFSQQFYNPVYAPPNRLTLLFESPTTFNWSVNSHYLPLPDPRLILTSLYTKWNAFSGSLSLEDDELLDHFLKALRVRYVQVQNTSALINRHRVPCFRGKLGLSFSRKTPQPLHQLLMMLLCYAEFSGIGAKTAMGLGDCKIISSAGQLILQEETSDSTSLEVPYS